MLKFKILSFLIFSVLVGRSQQMPQYSQYLRNQYMINPGAAGIYNFVDITIGGRMQWAGFVDAPSTTYISVSTLLNGANKRSLYNPGLHSSTGVIKNPSVSTGKFKHAIGGQFLADQFGAFRNIQLSGTYAAHVPLSKKYNLSFGAKLGLSNNNFLQDRAVVANASSVVDNTYTSFTSNQANTNVFNIGAGFYLYSKDLFLGISADQLSKSMISFGSGTASIDPKIHLNVTGGIKVLINADFTLTPAFLVKYMNPINPSIEGSLQCEFKERVWAAASYRNKDAIIGMIGMTISNKFKFGYSYDFSTSQFRKYSSGGHELILGIML